MGTSTTTDGRITVWTPDDPEWRIEVLTQGRAIAFKCKRTTPGELCFFLAKIYEVPPENIVPAEQLLREVYPQIYGKQFAQVTLVSAGDFVGDDDAQWWEAHYELVHAQAGAISKLERVRCVGNEIYLTSAEGHTASMLRHAEAARAWMDHARFGAGSLAQTLIDPILGR